MIFCGEERFDWDEELNLYAIVANDPINQFDLLGLQSIPGKGVLKKAMKMTRRKLLRCLCLDSVTAFHCRCIRDNQTDLEAMSKCICQTIPDASCEPKVKKILEEIKEELNGE